VVSSISIIGAGRLGATLALAMHAAGLPVTMVASRRPSSAEALAHMLPGCIAVDAQEAATAALVFLTVPDDDIGAVADTITWHAGQAVVHCSGATEVSVLKHAQDAGAEIGGFHPIQVFTNPLHSISLLPGTTVGIEGSEALLAMLSALAKRLQMTPMVLPAGVRARYHGGSLFMSSFLLSMFHQSAQVWASFGMTEQQTLAALLPLATGVIKSAGQQGLAASLAGPISRGDVNVVSRHIAALGALDARHRDFYLTLSQRQLELARQAAKLSPEKLARLAAVIESETDQ
jgi:predicted short-subunit dehydrogenase-like oxidoreductase (DUF2520 family)